MFQLRNNIKSTFNRLIHTVQCFPCQYLTCLTVNLSSQECVFPKLRYKQTTISRVNECKIFWSTISQLSMMMTAWLRSFSLVSLNIWSCSVTTIVRHICRQGHDLSCHHQLTNVTFDQCDTVCLCGYYESSCSYDIWLLWYSTSLLITRTVHLICSGPRSIVWAKVVRTRCWGQEVWPSSLNIFINQEWRILWLVNVLCKYFMSYGIKTHYNNSLSNPCTNNWSSAN